MIRALVDYALNNRFLVTSAALMLLIWGAISFHNLPVEAYPDVANNYVQVITQWPGRAAEEVEQQVTIPIEIVMNGIPHLEHLRSTSLFGLSSTMLIFDDQSSNDLNRQKVLERLTQAVLPNGLTPQIGSDYSPVGQIYWYTLKSTNPQYDLMELKSLQDWTLEKQFKSVPNVVDVVSFGGTTREYQVNVDPDKLVSYGLSISQVEQQLSSNNVNAGTGMPVEGEVKAAVEAVAKWFAGEGAIVEPVAPVMSRAILDGLDSFFRARSWSDIEQLAPEQRARIHPYTRKWAESGATLSGVDVIRGFNQSMALRSAAAALFDKIEYLISPTAPIPAFAAERASPGDDPAHPFEHIAFTVPWNFTEQPAVSINAAFTQSGLPIGVQLIGRRFDDHGVLRMAKAWETARGPITNWPKPPG